MKVISIISLLTTFLSMATYALDEVPDGGSSHGGDICENRFKIVRDDIHSWIDQGGPVGLRLPAGITVADYSARMLTEIASAQISCTDDIVKVGDAEKTCKNFTSGGTDQILCNRTRFMSTNESDQYVLVHHEYAGLAGLEVGEGSSSDYSISNQIAGYLEDHTEKRLVVKPVHPIKDYEILKDDDGNIQLWTQRSAMNVCPAGTHLPTAREFAEWSHSLGAKGILEISAVPAGKVPSGYTLLSGINPNGTTDSFYYNSDGYQRPANLTGDGQDLWQFWSSSLPFSTHAYTFMGSVGSGHFSNQNINYYYNETFGSVAVICFRGQSLVAPIYPANGGEILVNADGTVKYLTQTQAMRACPAGTHLPSARELAEWSQSLGAKGILETSNVPADAVPSGYTLYSAVNPDGTTDSFYFNYNGYKGSADTAVSSLGFWSTSKQLNRREFALYLKGYNGEIRGAYRSHDLEAVRCFPGQ